MAIGSTGADTPALHYTIDPGRSDVSARVAFFGLARKTAHFPKISGGITLSPDHLEAIDLKVTLDARALTAGDPVTIARLKGRYFFDVAHYPNVTFVGRRMIMTGPRIARVSGDITARGVTRPAQLDLTFARPPAGEHGLEPMQLTASTRINRRDFGMEAYGLIVGSTVTVTIDAVMIPQTP